MPYDVASTVRIKGEIFYADGWYIHTTKAEALAEANRLRKLGYKVRTVPKLADRRYRWYINYTRPKVNRSGTGVPQRATS